MGWGDNMAFDPDNYLAQKTGRKPSRGFVNKADAGTLPPPMPPIAPPKGLATIPAPSRQSSENPSSSKGFDPDAYLESKKTKTPWSAVPGNAVKDVKSILQGLSALGGKVYRFPSEIVQTVAELAKGGEFGDTPIGQDAATINAIVNDIMPHFEKTEEGYKFRVGSIAERAKDIITDPGEAFRQNPVNTVADVLSVAVPIGKVAAGTKAGQKALEVGEKALDVTGKVIAPISEAAGTGGRKAMSAVFGPSEEAIRARLERNAAIAGAKTTEDLAEDLAGSANQLSEQITKYDKRAWETLSRSHNPNEGAFSRAEILNTLRDIRKQILVTGGGTVGTAQRKAIKTIDGIISDIKTVGSKVRGTVKSAMGVPSSIKNADYLSQAQVKEIVQALRKNVNWQDDTAELANSAIEAASETLDANLKTRNQAYAKAMEPVSERMDALKDTQRLFNLKKKPGEGSVASDTTATKIEGVTRKNKSVSQATLDKVKKFTGRDYIQGSEDFRFSQEFKGGSPNGARRVAGFGAVGGTIAELLNIPFQYGAGAGAAAGLAVDKFGGRMAADLIDWYVRNQPMALGRYAPIMIQAAEKGAPAIAFMHSIFERDPEYRATIQRLKQ